MTNSTRHLLAAIALNATVLASCSASAQEPAATEPLEVKLVGVDECARGWTLVQRDDGWTIYYPHPTGARIPNWVDEDGLRAAFTRPDGRVAVAEFEAAKGLYRRQHRIICRWTPIQGDPA